jgi:hypothetical protein
MRCAIGVQQYEVDFPWKNRGGLAKNWRKFNFQRQRTETSIYRICILKSLSEIISPLTREQSTVCIHNFNLLLVYEPIIQGYFRHIIIFWSEQLNEILFSRDVFAID